MSDIHNGTERHDIFPRPWPQLLLREFVDSLSDYLPDQSPRHVARPPLAYHSKNQEKNYQNPAKKLHFQTSYCNPSAFKHFYVILKRIVHFPCQNTIWKRTSLIVLQQLLQWARSWHYRLLQQLAPYHLYMKFKWL